MKLLDIIETTTAKGNKVSGSPIYINSGGLGLNLEQKEMLVKAAIEMQCANESRRAVNIGAYKGHLNASGDFRHPSLGYSGKRYIAKLSNVEVSGEFDFMICPPVHLTCGGFPENTQESVEEKKDWKDWEYPLM